MPCRHDMTREARRKLLVINVGVLVLKLTELVVFIGEARRIRKLRNTERAAIVVAERIMEGRRPAAAADTKENES